MELSGQEYVDMYAAKVKEAQSGNGQTAGDLPVRQQRTVERVPETKAG
jgi:1-acyl-sn-glycerol-3-phosphate acyltransferase